MADNRQEWLNPALSDVQQLQALMGHTEAQYLAYPVSSYVNKPVNTGEQCVVAVNACNMSD